MTVLFIYFLFLLSQTRIPMCLGKTCVSFLDVWLKFKIFIHKREWRFSWYDPWDIFVWLRCSYYLIGYAHVPGHLMAFYRAPL